MAVNKRPRLDEDGSSLTNQGQVEPTAKAQLVRACAECKKHKIKCEMAPGQSACNKCVRSGVTCIPYNFAQKHIDEDKIWKAQASSDIDQLRAAVQYLLQHSNLPELAKFDGTVPSITTPISTIAPSTTATAANFLSEGPSTVNHDDDSDLVPVPMNNLYSLTEPGNSRLIRVDAADANGPDFIARGIVTLAEAEYLFNHFCGHINPLLWDGMLCPYRSLQDARKSSTLLVATVLTVAALHVHNRDQSLHATYDAFVNLMRGTCLLRSQNLDDVRGLCIGAFYLTSLSWALCSRAVRIATEMNLHKPSLQFSRATRESYDRVRLWYVLYVCDHQFALAYGRPPMMHEDAAVRNVEKFLLSDLCTSGDVRLVAQVGLFRILAESYFMYGCDPDLELGEKDFEKLHAFNVAVDQWRLTYQSKTTYVSGNAAWPPKATLLYYHLARFQLNSSSLRGISARNAPKETSYTGLSWDRCEAANIAISAATSTLKLIIEEQDLCRALVSMPIFIHAMISVCASFVLKMAVAFGDAAWARTSSNDPRMVVPRDLSKFGLNFHTEGTLSMVQDLTRVLSSVADKASSRHVLKHIVTGLKELLQRFEHNHDGNGLLYSQSNIGQTLCATNGGVYTSQLMAPDTDVRDHSLQRPQTHQLSTGPDHNASNAIATTNFAQVFGDDQDPFDLMGDLDWRFNDSLLWNIDGGDSFY